MATDRKIKRYKPVIILKHKNIQQDHHSVK